MSEETRQGGRPEPRRDYPYIHPEPLPKAEHLAIDAEDVEEFVEHYEHPRAHEEHGEAGTSH